MPGQITQMKRLHDLVGREQLLRDDVAQSIHAWAQAQNATAVGALHVTCSDESERECAEALQLQFVQHMLPPIKVARRSAFQLSNLGGRYEWGAAPLAEDHFLSHRSAGGYTLLIAKLNAHVALEQTPGSTEKTAFRLGVWDRYGRDSASCGALNSLLAGKHSLFLDDLHEAFDSEGIDRLNVLQDTEQVDPLYRPLFAAAVSARLQARKAILDLQDSEPTFPSYWVVLPCVTVNRHERDTEIVCGVYVVDGRDTGRVVTYSGLGDDPAGYNIERVHGFFTITDAHVGVQRPGRDHRQMVHTQVPLLRRSQADTVPDERLDRVRHDVQQNQHLHHDHARSLLRIALPVFSEVAPIPAAAVAFAHGMAGIHHAYTIHKLADQITGRGKAQQILGEVYGMIDQLEGARVVALLELLMNECTGRTNS